MGTYKNTPSQWLHGTGGAQQMDLVRDNKWVRPCRLCGLIHNMLKKVVICTIKFFCFGRNLDTVISPILWFADYSSLLRLSIELELCACIHICEFVYAYVNICIWASVFVLSLKKNILVGNISNAPAIHFHVEPYTHELNKIAMLLFSHCINIEPPYQLRLLHGSKRIMILFLYEPAHAC